MIRANRAVLFFASFALSIGLMACGGSSTTTENKGGTNAKPVENTKPAENKAENAKPAENKAENTKAADNSKPADGKETAGADTIGVPECDKYIENIEACLKDKVPEAARGAFKSGLDRSKKSWKDMAANPTTKAGLASACKAATDAAKTSMASFSCKWE